MGDHCKRLFFVIALILIVDAGTPAVAFQDSPNVSDKNFDVLFAQEQSLNNEELDALRGGFITRNDMVIDFVFSANTLVDGQLINQVVLNTADQSTLNNSLQKIIQIGDGNSAFSKIVDTDALPNVLTVIQNNLNDLTIQQVNHLDLSIKNFDNFIQQNVGPEMAFQSTFRLVQ